MNGILRKLIYQKFIYQVLVISKFELTAIILQFKIGFLIIYSVYIQLKSD